MSEDFSTLAPDLWTSLESIAQVRTYESRSVVFAQGQRAEGVYLIQRGKVRLWMPEDRTRMLSVDPAGAATMLGLSETIAQGTHKVSASALVPTQIGFVASEPLMKFLRERHDLCLQVVRVLSEDLHTLYHRFQGLKTSHPRSKRGPASPGFS